MPQPLEARWNDGVSRWNDGVSVWGPVPEAAPVVLVPAQPIALTNPNNAMEYWEITKSRAQETLPVWTQYLPDFKVGGKGTADLTAAIDGFEPLVQARTDAQDSYDACFRAAQDALLRTLSSRIFDISARVGDGARTKLVNNLLAGINLVGAAEVLALAERLGLSAQATLDVIGQSSGQSWIGQDRMARAVAGDFEPRAHMTLLEKDTRLALEAAHSVGFVGPLGAAAARTFAQASAAGLHSHDDAALLLWLRQQNPGGEDQHPGQ